MQMVVHQLVGNDLVVWDVALKLYETSNGMDLSVRGLGARCQ